MTTPKATSPPPPHKHFSPPPSYGTAQSLNEVKEDTVVESIDSNSKSKDLNGKMPSKIAISTLKLKSKQNPNIDETKQEETFVKKKLLYHLQTRPPRQQLVNLNILRAFDQDSSLRAVMDNLMKQRLRMLLSSRILDKKLSNRKSIQSLIREGILKEADDGLEEEEEEKGNRRDMYRRMSNHSLTEFLSRRPTLQELVKANMVQDVMTWTKIPCTGTVPRARNCHQMCLNRDDTAIYLVGGFNTGSVSVDLLKFDIQNQKWSRPLVGGPVPPERYCHTVVNIDSNLVVFGGFSVEGKWLNDLHALDTEYAMNSEFQAFVPRLSAYGQCKASTNNSQMLLWYPPEATGDPPSPRAAHAACVVGKMMYIFGGNNYNQLFNDLHCLDSSNMKWSQVICQGQVPSPRANHSLTAIGDKYLVVFGGNDGQPLNDIHIFDIEKNTWTQPEIHGTPPIARGGHSAVCVKNKQLLIFAGGYNSKLLNDLYILDVETMTWIRPSDTGMLPEPRAGHSCCVTANNVVYICGGGDSENDKLFNDLYQLDTGYFTTDEKQISKLIYNKQQTKATAAKHKMEKPKNTPPLLQSIPHHRAKKERQPPYSMSKSSYEYNNGDFKQSNFNDHVQHFIQKSDEEYGHTPDYPSFGQFAMYGTPLMQAGVISDDITNISEEIDMVIGSVENGIKSKINEFRQKEQGYIMILRSIEAERTKLIDDVNRDITMLKFSVKESLDKLQQKFIAKMLRKHVDYVNSAGHDSPNHPRRYAPPNAVHGFQSNGPNAPKSKSKGKAKTTLIRTQPLINPALGTIQEEPQHKHDENKNRKGHKVKQTQHSREEIKEPQRGDVKALQRKGLRARSMSAPNILIPQPPPPPQSQADMTNGGKSPVNSSQSPLPANSQSPNPTQSALQQQQMGMAKPTNTMIDAALAQQAAFQKHQMMAGYWCKLKELQRQQKLRQLATERMHLAEQMHNNPNTNPNPNAHPNWWQNTLLSYQYNPNLNAPPVQNPQTPPAPVKPKAKKKRRKKKKRNKNKKKAEQNAMNPAHPQPHPQAHPPPPAPMEGNINLPHIQTMMNNNNNITFNNSGMPYPAYNQHPAQYSPQSNTTGNVLSSLNPNAMSFQ